MILDLEKLPQEKSSLVVDEVVAFRDVDGEERRVECHIGLDVRKSGETFYVHADVDGELPTSCHRCLQPVRHRMTPSFEVVIQRSREPVAEAEAADGSEDFVVLPYGTTRFSLDQYIYENLVVEIPMQIVCSERCKGLCPGCGANLNNEACRCEAVPDSRWKALKNLKKPLSE